MCSASGFCMIYSFFSDTSLTPPHTKLSTYECNSFLSHPRIEDSNFHQEKVDTYTVIFNCYKIEFYERKLDIAISILVHQTPRRPQKRKRCSTSALPLSQTMKSCLRQGAASAGWITTKNTVPLNYSAVTFSAKIASFGGPRPLQPVDATRAVRTASPSCFLQAYIREDML